MQKEEKKVTPGSPERSMGAMAFYPFFIFIGIVVAKIIYNIIAGLPQTGNSFPIISVAIIASISSFFFGRGTVHERVDAFTKGAADPNVMMMVVIILLSGIFTSVSTEMGGISSLTNFLLSFMPKHMIYAGILFVTSVISLSIGSSVGSATAMAPVAAGLAAQAGLSVPIAVSAVLGGAAFGDNLSFISDTTIAATRGLNVEMRDKFKFNIKLALPAFLIAMVIYTLIGTSSQGGTLEIGSYNFIKMLPYFFIIIAAVCGMNMMLVLTIGIAFSTILGFVFSGFTVDAWMSAVSAGMTKMTNSIFTALLAKGIIGVVEYNGGIQWLIHKLTSNIRSEKGAQYSISALTFCLGALIRSTSAIIVAAPLAKEICEPYEVDPRRTASLLDIFGTAQNGFVFWAGLTVDIASLVDGVNPTDLIFYPIYPALIVIMALLSIQFNLFSRKRKTGTKKRSFV